MAVVEYHDNLDEVLEALEPLSKNFTVRFRAQNVLDYARKLHEREAYYVFSDEELMKVTEEQFSDFINAGVMLSKPLVVKMAEAIGWRYLNFLRSTTEKMRPALSSKEGPRFAHPGNWADRTGNLAASFRFKAGSKPFKGNDALPEPANK